MILKCGCKLMSKEDLGKQNCAYHERKPKEKTEVNAEKDWELRKGILDGSVLPDDFCTFCEEKFKKKDYIIEIAVLGPVRRSHNSCFTELFNELRKRTNEEIITMVEENEKEKGIQR